MDEVARIVAATTVPGARAKLLPAHLHTPMERTPAVAALVAAAQGVARDLGFEVGEASTGGAGDANTTAAAGLPKSTAWPQWAATLTGLTSGLTSTASSLVLPSWPGCWPGWGPGRSAATTDDLGC